MHRDASVVLAQRTYCSIAQRPADGSWLVMTEVNAPRGRPHGGGAALGHLLVSRVPVRVRWATDPS